MSLVMACLPQEKRQISRRGLMSRSRHLNRYPLVQTGINFSTITVLLWKLSSLQTDEF